MQVVADDIALESMSEAFQALTTDYRLSLPYIARVICIEGRHDPVRRAGQHAGQPVRGDGMTAGHHRHRGRAGRRAAPAAARRGLPGRGAAAPGRGSRPDRPRAAGRAAPRGYDPSWPCQDLTGRGPGRAVSCFDYRTPIHTDLVVRIADPSRQFVAAPVRTAALAAHRVLAAEPNPPVVPAGSRLLRPWLAPGSGYRLPRGSDQRSEAGWPAPTAPRCAGPG